MYQSSVVNYLVAAIFLNQKVRARNIWVSCFFLFFYPFGALLVHKGKILLEAENTVNTEEDVTRHAELNLVSKASRTISPGILKECTLYTSTEPCAMCSGAIYWSGIRKVVYGTSAKTRAEMSGYGIDIPAAKIFDSTHPKVEIIGPVYEEEADQLR